MPTKKPDPVQQVRSILEDYAARGVFRGFSAGTPVRGRASFRMTWHHDREYELIFDPARKTFRFPGLLPGIPAGSEMERKLRDFVASLQAANLPAHRRIEPAKAQLRATNQAGKVSIGLQIKNGDFDYGARKTIQAVHEIFLDFLGSGPYFDYLVENFGLDPDRY